METPKVRTGERTIKLKHISGKTGPYFRVLTLNLLTSVCFGGGGGGVGAVLW